MGILDDLKHKVEKLGDKAREGFDDARDKAGDLLGDAKERFGGHDEPTGSAPLGESADVGPDTSSTDAVQPGYVTAEDDVTGTASDESSLTDDVDDLDDEADDGDDDADEAFGTASIDDSVAEIDDSVAEEESLVAEPAGSADVAHPAAAELDAEELVEDDDAADLAAAPEPVAAEAPDTADTADTEVSEPAVETDVDPYEQPLTESIGDEIASALVDQEAVAEAVKGTSDEELTT